MPAQPAKQDTEPESELISDIAGFTNDPLGFVLYSYPWNEKGSPLEGKAGPRKWQRDVLDEIGAKLRADSKLDVWEAVREAVSSGHGIGKSTMVAWLCQWAMSTHEDTRGVITANTDTQLRTKTWPEMSKWYQMLICKHWFELTATAMYSAAPGHDKTWRVDIIPWSEHNTEAFAGLHNEGKRIIVLFDEGSGIHDKIWEVTEGAQTDSKTQIIWCVFGNPTRNTGRFKDCFGKFAHRWKTRSVDSRDVEGANLEQSKQWVEDWGEDSDFVRVRVRGMFPRASEMQLIETDVVARAMRCEPMFIRTDPLIVGIDVARGGSDNNVIAFRRGMDARTIPWVVIPGSETRDTTQFIARVAMLLSDTDPFRKPDAVFVDGTGIGGPLIDRLRQLGFNCVHEVQFSWAATSKQYGNLANIVTEMWMKGREALKLGLAIPNDPDLERELTERQYTHDKKDRLILNSKEMMKADGLASPDRADALFLTFAFPVASRDFKGFKHSQVETMRGHDPMAVLSSANMNSGHDPFR